MDTLNNIIERISVVETLLNLNNAYSLVHIPPIQIIFGYLGDAIFLPREPSFKNMYFEEYENIIINIALHDEYSTDVPKYSGTHDGFLYSYTYEIGSYTYFIYTLRPIIKISPGVFSIGFINLCFFNNDEITFNDSNTFYFGLNTEYIPPKAKKVEFKLFKKIISVFHSEEITSVKKWKLKFKNEYI